MPGSHEIATFNNLDKNSTKAEWNEVIREIPRMWEEQDYMYEGESFTVPYPHNILPKPYQRKGHPPIWVGCGNPGTFTQAGELGIGAIAFNFEPIYNLKGRIDAYKEGIANCTEPLGQFKNDNVMMTNAVICLNDRKRARAGRPAPGSGLPLLAGVQLPRHHPPSGGCADLARAAPHHRRRGACSTALIENGWLLCGEPDEVAEQVAKYQTVGCDQLVFGLPSDSLMEDEVHEMLEVFGTKVIPQFDTDPLHSTTRYRDDGPAQVPALQLPRPGHHRGGAAHQRHDPAGRVPDAVVAGRPSGRSYDAIPAAAGPGRRPGASGPPDPPSGGCSLTVL